MRALCIAIVCALLSLTSGCGVNFGGDPTVRADPTAVPEASDDAETESASPEEPDDPAAEGPTEDQQPVDDDAGDGSDGDTDQDSVPATPAVPDQEPIDPNAEENQTGDRIVVQTAESQLFTIAPDGTDRIDLTTDDRSVARHNQPTWSPDGSRIAWVTQQPPSEGPPLLRTDRFDLSSPTSIDVDTPPFYLSWAADSARVAYLAPTTAGIDLGLAPITDDPAAKAQRLDRGQPFFFSWGPEPDELLVHASGFRLDRIKADGSTRIIEEFPAPFNAPAWLGEEDTLVYADEVEGKNYLVTTGPLGEGRVELASFEGSLTFTVNPGATRVVMIARPLAEQPDPQEDFVTASYQFDEDDFDEVDEVPMDTLSIMGTFGGDLWPLTFGTVIAWFWDPTGESLAWLEADGTSLRWMFSDGRETVPGPTFEPSTTLRNEYLPFFDQYDQSMTLFSPDGSQLTFAGTLSNGESGIFVVDTVPGATPIKIADGVFSAWSPTSAGGAFSVL